MPKKESRELTIEGHQYLKAEHRNQPMKTERLRRKRRIFHVSAAKGVENYDKNLHPDKGDHS